MDKGAIISWLLEGDVSVQYQVHRDLLSRERPELRLRIERKGWGARLLAERNANGHWGRGFYQPKWVSSHYTLLDLKNLGIAPGNPLISETIGLILEREKAEDGGVNPAATIAASDVCVNGMFLNYACYFGSEEEQLCSIVDFILTQRLPDGGFNCRFNRSGARHSSLHSTLSILEGILEYKRNGYTYRLPELEAAESSSQEFILLHQLFLSDRTGAVIHPNFIRLPYPGRWKYDILRALDYFRYSRSPWDARMEPAIKVLLNKRRKDGTWPLQAKHPGQVHFDMEQAGKPSRWNTLRALRVLQYFDVSI